MSECGACRVGRVVSCGACRVGRVVWGVSCGACRAGRVVWGVSCGACRVGRVVWGVLHIVVSFILFDTTEITICIKTSVTSVGTLTVTFS
ncbi:hypothetical protein RR48_00192 [Papilio machaon]|uniref:Uncharacterized protein n=1 Tax=Papilio machaon TaxID=76193 RepID=A0A0N0PFP8_PAPMA|nr:hypothetical protein RR48_00192 [Papilio machaon]